MGRKTDRARTEESASQAARSQRNATLLSAACHRQDGTIATIRVRNLSATGIKGECRDVLDFVPDEPVRIAFGRLAPITAKIVRSHLGEVGVQFSKPIDLEMLNQARREPLPIEQSPRSEVVGDWIHRAACEREQSRAKRASSGKRSV